MVFYKILNTGLESLFPLISDGEKSSLAQVYTDGKFIEATYELVSEFTTWTFEFNDDYIKALSNLEIKKIDEIVKAWINIEDCPYDNQKDLKDLITALNTLAVKSLHEKTRMFFRMEL